MRMRAETVAAIFEALDRAGLPAWVDGGWGVDALLGEQSRPHSDLDLIIDAQRVDELRRVLGALGFSERSSDSARAFVLANALCEAIDVHAVRFDARGFGCFDVGDGREWPFPPRAFAATGIVHGRSVRCLSPEAQVMCHAQGYVPTEKDVADMERLQRRFGVVLPLALCRAPTVGPPSAATTDDAVASR